MNIATLPELTLLPNSWVECFNVACRDSIKHGFEDDLLVTWKDVDSLFLDSPIHTFISEGVDHQSFVEWMGWDGETFLGLLPVVVTSEHVNIEGEILVGHLSVVGTARHLQTTNQPQVAAVGTHYIRIRRGARKVNGTMVGVKVDAFRISQDVKKGVRKHIRMDGVVCHD